MAAKEVQLAVRVTKGMQAALKKAAGATGRTGAGYMVFAIAKMLREDGFEIVEEPKRSIPRKPVS